MCKINLLVRRIKDKKNYIWTGKKVEKGKVK